MVLTVRKYVVSYMKPSAQNKGTSEEGAGMISAFSVELHEGTADCQYPYSLKLDEWTPQKAVDELVDAIEGKNDAAKLQEAAMYLLVR